MVVKNSSNISLEFNPWTDTGYRITKLHMVEGLGGEVPKGVMSLEHSGSDEAMKLITDTNTGTIKLLDNKEKGIQYTDIKVFITKKTNIYNMLEIEFVCVSDKKFFTDLISTTYPSIKEAIETVYPGNKDIRIEPDSGVDGIVELQNAETSYDFCKKLCYAYKANSIFAFGWEGLLIKDLINGVDSMGNNEPYMEMIGGEFMFNTTPYALNYNKKLNHDPYDPWIGTQDDNMLPTTKKDYSDVTPKNVGVVMEYSNYTIVGKNFLGHLLNTRYNERIMDSELYTNFTVRATDMPSYKLGDVVIWKQPHDEDFTNPFTKYLVKSNELFWTSDDNDGETDWTGLRLSWTSTLVGLDDGMWAKDNQEGGEQ